MPGFAISTRSVGSDDNGKPHIELYYLPNDPVSMIQKAAVMSIDKYNMTMYDASNEMERVQSKMIRTAPTTLALDDNYEIERWEVATHADDILKVLDEW